LSGGRRRPNRDEIENAPYEVGYGKPPKHSQFAKGMSGNPGGRPKGAKNKPRDAEPARILDVLREEAARLVPVREGDKVISISVARAVMRMLGLKAAKGDLRAIERFHSILHEADREERKARLENLAATLTYKMNAEAEIMRAKAEGLPPPEFEIHPDQIDIDYATARVTIRAPMNAAQRAVHEELQGRKRHFEEQAEKLRRILALPDVRKFERDELPGLVDTYEACSHALQGQIDLIRTTF